MTGRLLTPVRFWFGIVIALAGLPAVALQAGAAPSASAAPLDLRAASIVIPRRPANAAAERLAADVLREEIEKRTGFVWTTSDQWPAQGVAVAIAVGPAPDWGPSMPTIAMRPEAYRLVSGTREGRPVIWIQGADPRKVVGTVNSAEFFLTMTISATFIYHLGIADLAGATLGLLIGGLLAAPLGAWAAKHFPAKQMLILVGVVLTLTSAYGVWRAWG